MAPKRSKVYRRTFVGCWTCRRRKIKCDATRPHCQRCHKSRLECEGYGIKLNWSVPLVVQKGEMGVLGGKGDVNADEQEQSFQRSSIDFVRWWLYDYYEDVDADLAELEKKGTRVGPFGVFRCKDSVNAHGDNNNNNNTISNTNININSSRTKTRYNGSKHRKQLLSMLKKLTTESSKTSTLSSRSPSPSDLLQSNSNMIALFLDKSQTIFDSKTIFQLKDEVPRVLGNFHIYHNELDLCLLLSITLSSFLLQTQIIDSNQIQLIIMLNHSIKSLFTKIQTSASFQSYKNLPFLLTIMIMINTNLGLYDPNLFHCKFNQNHNPLCQDYYEYYTSLNDLLNFKCFQFTPRFKDLYQDQLDKNYNLLKDIKLPHMASSSSTTTTATSSSRRLSGQAEFMTRLPSSKILISTTETPSDKIIKIPKFIEEEDLDGNEPPPPTFTVHFTNDYDDEEDHHHNDQSLEQHNTDSHNRSPSPLEEPKHLFQLLCNDHSITSIFNLSANLVYSFHQVCQLINHRRYFQRNMGMYSRNFPKICAEFEDLLVLKFNQDFFIKMGGINSQFYNLIIILYFKYVKNYPNSMLTYHFNKIQPVDELPNQELFKFFSTINNDYDWGFTDSIWANNWQLKEWLTDNSNNNPTNIEEWCDKDLFLI